MARGPLFCRFKEFIMHAILGIKKGQTQAFLTDGTRVPVTKVAVVANPVTAIMTKDANGYVAVQLGVGTRKHAKKPQLGHAKKGANLDYAPSFLQEIRFEENVNLDELPKVGDKIEVATVLEAGDIVDVTGLSKGKGFAGVVKRHHFKGGPRTHGQSDRERAPGSLGQTTTPGRVYKGKRMAGKMGNDMVTVKNLMVIDVTGETVLVAGLLPGIGKEPLRIVQTGKAKNFLGIVKEEVKPVATEEAASVVEQVAEVAVETKE